MKRTFISIISLSLILTIILGLVGCKTKKEPLSSSTPDATSELEVVSYDYNELFSSKPEKHSIVSDMDGGKIKASDYVKIPCTMEVPELFKTKPCFEVYNENQETMYYTRMWKDENNPDVIYAISEYLGTDGCPSLKGNNLAYVSEMGKTTFVCEKSMDKYFNNEKYPANVYDAQMKKTDVVSTSSTDIYKQESDLMEFVYTFYELGNLYDTEYIYVTGYLVNHYALPIQVWAIDTSKDHLYKDEILKITSKIAKSVRISYPDNEPK